MASRKSISRRTPAQNTREITRRQYDFSSGEWPDLPEGSVPLKGLVKLTNGVAIPGKGIQGRRGNRVIGTSYPTLATGIAASKTGAVITITSGYSLSSADVGRYFKHDDGTEDPIVSVNAGLNTITTDNSTAHTASTAGKIRDEVNSYEWHPVARKMVLHIGTKIYTSPWPLTTWTEVVRNVSAAIGNVKSTMSVFNEVMIVRSSTGIYAIEFSPILRYYKVNAPLPMYKQADSTTGAYRRRMLTTFVALSGDHPLRQRIDEGVRIVHESGTLSLRSIPSYGTSVLSSYVFGQQDYWERRSASAISSSNPADSTLFPDGAEEGFDHYGIYSTLDTGTNGIDPNTGVGNDSDKYFWQKDVPFIKVFLATRSAGDATCTANTGNNCIDPYDVNALILHSDGSYSSIANYSTTNKAIAMTTQTTELVSVASAIGAAKVAKVNQSATTVTITSSSFAFASTDVGRRIYFSDGTSDIITAILTTATASVTKSRTLSGVAAAWVAEERNYHDVHSDEDLRLRAGFELMNRFLQPLPNGNEGCVSPGLFWITQNGQPYVYYCNTGEKYMVGYYHPAKQVHHLDDNVVCLSAFESSVIAYCKNSFVFFDLSSLRTMSAADNEQTSVPLGTLPISTIMTSKHVAGIGALCRGAVRKNRDGVDCVVCSDRGLRIHDGYKFGPNLIEKRRQKDFSKLQAALTLHYDKVTGLLAFGTEEAL